MFLRLTMYMNSQETNGRKSVLYYFKFMGNLKAKSSLYEVIKLRISTSHIIELIYLPLPKVNAETK